MDAYGMLDDIEELAADKGFDDNDEFQRIMSEARETVDGIMKDEESSIEDMKLCFAAAKTGTFLDEIVYRDNDAQKILLGLFNHVFLVAYLQKIEEMQDG